MRSERGMFVALRDIHATDPQRVAVMAAWDEYEDARKAAEARFEAQVQAALGDRYRDWQRTEEQARDADGDGPRGGGRRGGGPRH